MWEILTFLIRKVSNIAYVGCSFYSKELEEHFLGVRITSLQGINGCNVIVRLREKYCKEFSIFYCNYVRIMLSELEKGVSGEISVEARGARTRGDLVL